MTPDQIDAIRTFARGLPSDGTAPDTAILQLAWDYEDLQSQLAAANERADAAVKALKDAREQVPFGFLLSDKLLGTEDFVRGETCDAQDTETVTPLYAAPVPAQPAVVPEDYPQELRDCASALRKLFDRNCRVVSSVLEIPCGNHDEAFNFIVEAREISKRADAILSATDTEVKK